MLDFIESKKNDKRLELTYGCPGFLGLNYEKEVRKHYKCEHWEYCLGGAFHTWNFSDNEQNKCTYKMINEK